MLRSTKIVHVFNIIKTVLWRPGQILARFRERCRDHRDTECGQLYFQMERTDHRLERPRSKIRVAERLIKPVTLCERGSSVWPRFPQSLQKSGNLPRRLFFTKMWLFLIFTVTLVWFGFLHHGPWTWPTTTGYSRFWLINSTTNVSSHIKNDFQNYVSWVNEVSETKPRTPPHIHPFSNLYFLWFWRRYEVTWFFFFFNVLQRTRNSLYFSFVKVVEDVLVIFLLNLIYFPEGRKMEKPLKLLNFFNWDFRAKVLNLGHIWNYLGALKHRGLGPTPSDLTGLEVAWGWGGVGNAPQLQILITGIIMV